MTDSGSFDPGDLIYSADMQNLYNLVNAKCALAGVTGIIDVSVSWFSVGNSLGFWKTNKMVEAYQRAWDASTNKPGVRQSTVTSGSLCYGALFQNMWTQLNSMVFDAWPGWDETTEAGLQSANEYAVICENPAANGNEAGLGGGLSGADLNLTCGGTFDGATGSPLRRNRPAAGGNRLDWTYPAIDAFLVGRSVYTFYWKVYDLNSGGGGNYQYLNDFYGPSQYIPEFGVGSSGNIAVYASTAANGVLFNWTGLGTYSGSGPFYAAFWCDGSRLRVGWSSSRFTGWSQVPTGQRAEWTGNPTWATSNGSRLAVFGTPGGTIANFGARWFVASKRCLINNAA